VKILPPILALYFLVLFPAIHLVFSANKFLYEFWAILYFAITLLLVLVLKKVSLQQLGFNNTWKALTIGTIVGIIPIISVILFDGWLVKSGLSQSELFIGADLRIPQEMKIYMSLSGNIFTAIIVTFFDQLFVVGLVVNNLLKRQKIGQTIIGGGLLYSLFHFKPNLGNLFLGMISAGLLRATGSILVPILVHLGFAIAEILIVFNYPRLISILVFFV
jgi:hypothetical protein